MTEKEYRDQLQNDLVLKVIIRYLDKFLADKQAALLKLGMDPVDESKDTPIMSQWRGGIMAIKAIKHDLLDTTNFTSKINELKD